MTNFKGNNIKPENTLTSLAMMKQMHIPYYLKGVGWYCRAWGSGLPLFLGKNKSVAVKTLKSFAQ